MRGDLTQIALLPRKRVIIGNCAPEVDADFFISRRSVEETGEHDNYNSAYYCIFVAKGLEFWISL
jgi:hypothetical protein